MRFLQDALLQGFLTLERVKGTPSAGKRVNRTDSPFSATINNPKDTVV
jgi:hypothetical protein